MRLMSQSRAHTCEFFDAHDFFYSQLHVVFGVFNSHFSVDVDVSVTVHNSPQCCALCSDEWFNILDHASTTFQLKIKEAISIQ